MPISILMNSTPLAISDLAATCFTSRIVALAKSLIPSSATRPSTISFLIGVSIVISLLSSFTYS